jgi:type II secretory pathway pseudopilin PulG
MRTSARAGNPDGFALLEVLITAALVVTVAAGASHVLAIAVRASQGARVRTVASMLAAEKLEQLRSLEWSHASTGDPVISISSSDVTTDLSTDPASDDGPGLTASPAGTLDADEASYVDYLDASGRRATGSGSPPASTVYVRRWAVRPVPGDPADTLVLCVRVITRAVGEMGSADAARLVTVVTRK